MLRELTRADWQAILKLPDELIPQALLLRGTRNLKRQYDLHRPYFEGAVEIGLPRLAGTRTGLLFVLLTFFKKRT